MQITTPLKNSDPIIRRTKPILLNLPKFDGSRSEYEGWKSLIKDKIDINDKIISSNQN